MQDSVAVSEATYEGPRGYYECRLCSSSTRSCLWATRSELCVAGHQGRTSRVLRVCLQCWISLLGPSWRPHTCPCKTVLWGRAANRPCTHLQMFPWWRGSMNTKASLCCGIHAYYKPSTSCQCQDNLGFACVFMIHPVHFDVYTKAFPCCRMCLQHTYHPLYVSTTQRKKLVYEGLKKTCGLLKVPMGF